MPVCTDVKGGTLSDERIRKLSYKFFLVSPNLFNPPHLSLDRPVFLWIFVHSSEFSSSLPLLLRDYAIQLNTGSTLDLNSFERIMLGALQYIKILSCLSFVPCPSLNLASIELKATLRHFKRILTPSNDILLATKSQRRSCLFLLSMLSNICDTSIHVSRTQEQLIHLSCINSFVFHTQPYLTLLLRVCVKLRAKLRASSLVHQTCVVRRSFLSSDLVSSCRNSARLVSSLVKQPVLQPSKLFDVRLSKLSTTYANASKRR